MSFKLFGILQLLVFTAVICFAKYEDFSKNITFQGNIIYNFFHLRILIFPETSTI